MKNYKIETKGHNQMIWDKMGRLNLNQDYESMFKTVPYIYISSNGEWSWDSSLSAFKEFPYNKISWKKFLKLPEDNPFEGREYYVMADNKKDIDYLLRIAEARGYHGYFQRKDYDIYDYKQRTFSKQGRIGGNYTESKLFGTKLTLGQFINGEWPEEDKKEEDYEWGYLLNSLNKLRSEGREISTIDYIFNPDPSSINITLKEKK